MKKVFIILTLLFSLIMVSFSNYYKKTETVLVGREIIAFDVEEMQENTKNVEYLEKSLKKLGILTYIDPETK